MLVIEEIMDRVARTLGLAPEVVRERNFYHGTGETNRTHYGADIGDNRIQDPLARGIASADFAGPPTRGGGVEPDAPAGQARAGGDAGEVRDFSFTLTHYNQGGALVHIYQDGSVQVNHGGTEMGQGLLHQDPGRRDARAGAAGGAYPNDEDEHRQGAEHVGDRGFRRRGSQRRRGAGGVRDPARAHGAGGGALA
jgi:hypothetical protein